MAVSWLANLEALLIDLDGVVYRGDLALPGATEVIDTLRRHQIAYAFVTNNATLTPEQFRTKLTGLGVAAELDDIVTSPVATGAYLQSIASPGTGVCVVGEEGLRQAMVEAGFALDDTAPSFVVVGLDRQLTYERLIIACRAIQGGAQLVATNADPALPVEDGLWPGAGAILAAITTTTGARPTIVGKPEPTLVRVALDRLAADPAHAAIIGDQIGSDIRAGKAAGIATILVAGELVSPPSSPFADVTPDLVVSDLAHLLECIDQAHSFARRVP
jgi:4-nitrophenyl phosphatase